MPVVDAYIMSGGISGDVSGDGNSPEQVSYQLRYFVQCDSPLDTPPIVIDHFRRTSGLPFLGSSYAAGNDRDSTAVCKSLKPSLVDRSGGIYYVDVSYEPRDGGESKNEQPSKGDPGKKTSDPLEWLDQIKTGSIGRSVPVWSATYRGANPDHIENELLPRDSVRMPCNSALGPFVPGLEKDLAIKTLSISKLTTKYDQTIDAFENTVNNDDFQILKPLYEFQKNFQKYKVKLASCPQEFTVINGFPYWRKNFEFHISPLPNGWRDEVADMGYTMMKRSGARLPNGTSASFVAPNEECQLEITGPDGQTLSTPSPLDGRGGMAGPKDPQVYLIWQKYDEQPFAPLAHTL